MWEKNEVRLFKLMSGSDEFAVVFSEDYETHVKSKMVETNANLVGGLIHASIYLSCVIKVPLLKGKSSSWYCTRQNSGLLRSVV